MSLIEKLAEHAFWSDSLPLARKMAAIIALSLSLDHAQASEPITGSASDEEVTVEWTYDLDANTGQIIVSHVQNHFVGYGGLIPEGATNVTCSGYGCLIDECLACVSAAPCPETIVFSYTPDHFPLAIEFDLPPPSWQKMIGQSEMNYYDGNLASSSVCSLSAAHSIDGFVTVVPIEIPGLRSDLDKDGDVDLHDYKMFQADFTGPM